MYNSKANKPIGIFDSGVGGLTVAKAVVEQLPHESIIYFGDTVHLPYGDKSKIVIQEYTKRIVDFLLEHEVKLILIACNSASAAAYEMLQSYVGDRALLVNVIDPVTRFLSEKHAKKKVGLIGTKLTVESGVYHQKLVSLDSQVDFHALATPLLVPMIEEMFFEHNKSLDVVLAEYLSDPRLHGIETLVLGCTHYPVIKKNITDFYRNDIDIIDASKIVAAEVKRILIAHNLLSSVFPQRHFYVSDYTEGFIKRARLFFGEEVSVELANIL